MVAEIYVEVVFAMSGYERVGHVSPVTVEELLGVALTRTDWQIVRENEVKECCTCTKVDEAVEHIRELTELWARDRWRMAWFVNVPAKTGHLHRHNDGVMTYDTFHIPLQTNQKVVNFMYDGEAKERFHLNVGSVYRINRAIDHESVNRGASDRIHLLMDVRRTGTAALSGLSCTSVDLREVING